MVVKTASSRLPALTLRRALVWPLVALTLILALSIGVVFYRAGGRAVETVTENLLLESSARIEQAIELNLGDASGVLDAAMPPQGHPPADIGTQLTSLRDRFWTATALALADSRYVYYGNESGQFLGVQRSGAGKGEMRVKLQATELRQIHAFVGIPGPVMPGRAESEMYEPRQRPWYEAAVKADAAVWTPVYANFGVNELLVTRARKVIAPDGTVAGVVATDVSLAAINSFVHRLQTSPGGAAFVVELDGSLIALSSGTNVARDAKGTVKRLKAGDSENPLVRAAWHELQSRFDAPSGSGDASRVFRFEVNGQATQGAYARMRESSGLQWLAVVVMPQSDFMGDVKGNALVTALVGAFAVGLILLVGQRLVGRVVSDIDRLSNAVRRIGRGDVNVRMPRPRHTEIAQLARDFEDMHAELSTDRLTGATSRAALLRVLGSVLTRYNQKAQPGPVFSVLFLDLNRFKAINDQFGHAAGDLTLVEVAARLRSVVREGDIVARFGGDEFVVVLWRLADPAGVERICDKIRDVLVAPLASLEAIEGAAGSTVGASIGVARYPADGADADALLKHADAAMYSNKSVSR